MVYIYLPGLLVGIAKPPWLSMYKQYSKVGFSASPVQCNVKLVTRSIIDLRIISCGGLGGSKGYKIAYIVLQVS